MSKPFPLIVTFLSGAAVALYGSDATGGMIQIFTRCAAEPTARIENLLDKEYELARGFNTPDRSAYIAVRYAPGT